MSATRQSPSSSAWPGRLAIGLAALVPGLLGLAVHSQGFNLMDDGLWLLGAQVLADGGHLYRDLFSIYGPARYVLLWPFCQVLGPSVLALAVLKACTDAAAAGFGFWLTGRLGAGRWAWLVPAGVLALGPVYPRYLAAAIFAGLVGGVLARRVQRHRGWLLGLAWGGLALFGFDMLAYGAVILLGGWLLTEPGAGRWPLWQPAGGLAVVLAPLAVVPLGGGYFDTVLWDTVLYPATRFGGEMGRSWWGAFLDSPYLHNVFAGHYTGEDLAPLWPGHALWRTAAWRGWYLLAWLLPVGALVAVRRMRLYELAPVAALTLAAWSTLLGRGDVDHLRLVAYGLVLVAPPLLARVAARRVVAGALLATVALLLLPRLGEQVWLATHRDRDTLAAWNRPTAGIRLGTERQRQLDVLLQDLAWDGHSPVVAWPAQPGLVFLLGAPPGTTQMTLLAGEVRDPAALIAELTEVPPQAVVLGRAAGLVRGVRNVRRLAPELYAHLRRNYSLDLNVATSEGNFRILHPLGGGAAALAALPVARRLPGDSQYVRNGTTPPLGPGQSAAQTVRVTEFDLSAVTLLVKSPGPWPQTIDLMLSVVEVQDGKGTGLLGQVKRQVVLQKETEQVALEFAPITGSHGRQVILDIQGNPATDSPFALYWHRRADGDDAGPDFYPDGQAFWNQEPVGGDLFFTVY